MTRLAIAPAARADLRDIRRYSEARFGEVIAKTYLKGLRGAFEMMLRRPRTGRLEADLGHNMRSLRFRSHRVYYRCLDASDEVTIVRVLHHARDVERAFGD